MLANPDTAHFTAFHLPNNEAKRSLKIKWNNNGTAYHIYIGVTLDRTLQYKEHIHNTNMNVLHGTTS